MDWGTIAALTIAGLTFLGWVVNAVRMHIENRIERAVTKREIKYLKKALKKHRRDDRREHRHDRKRMGAMQSLIDRHLGTKIGRAKRRK